MKKQNMIYIGIMILFVGLLIFKGLGFLSVGSTGGSFCLNNENNPHFAIIQTIQVNSLVDNITDSTFADIPESFSGSGIYAFGRSCGYSYKFYYIDGSSNTVQFTQTYFGTQPNIIVNPSKSLNVTKVEITAAYGGSGFGYCCSDVNTNVNNIVPITPPFNSGTTPPVVNPPVIPPNSSINLTPTPITPTDLTTYFIVGGSLIVIIIFYLLFIYKKK